MRGRTIGKRARLRWLAPLLLAGSTLFGSCGITDIRDNIIAGGLGAVQDATNGLISSFLPAF